MKTTSRSNARLRVLVFGNAGSGKSTYARRLAIRNNIRALDLDDVVWSRTEFGVFRPEREITSELDDFVRWHDSWVIEGCYGRIMEYLHPHCTEMVFMNPGEATCVKNCLARPWEPDKYPSTELQDAKLEELLDWVRAYYSRSDDMSLAMHRRLFDSCTCAKREITQTEPDL